MEEEEENERIIHLGRIQLWSRDFAGQKRCTENPFRYLGIGVYLDNNFCEI